MKPFFNVTGNSRQKFKYLENEKSFQDSLFVKAFQLPEVVSDLRVHF